MTAARKDIISDHGETRPWRLVYRQGRGLPPVDLTGGAALFSINDRLGAEVVLSTDNGGILPLGADGAICVQTAHALYAAMPPGEYSYRLSVTLAGEIRFLARGKWVIR